MVLDQSINHIEYINKLEQYMMPEYRAAEDLYDPIWQQDNAPAHRDWHTQEWLHDGGFRVLR